MKRSLSYFAAISFLIISVLFPLSASAQADNLSMRLWGQVSPLITGDAGSGPGAPQYDDAFDRGTGAGVELYWRLNDSNSLIAGIGYELYNGDSHEGISFEDLKVVPVYIGIKFPVACNAPHWAPYLRVDFGVAHLSSVDVSYESLQGKYWDSSWALLFDVGGGIEHRWDKWGVSLDVRLRFLSDPDPALGDPSQADPSWSVPVSFGVNYYF